MQTMSEHRQGEAIEQQLLAYLKTHPAASDTADGIARWWVAEPADAEAVASAMDRLVKRGIVERVAGPDAQLRYRKAKRGG